MDFTYSNLAYMDAYHDYKKYFSMKDYKDIIISGLPNKHILPIDRFVSHNDFEDLILDIFTARQKEVTVKTANKYSKEMYELGKTYLAYLYLYCSDDDSKSYPFTYPLHQINLGEFSQSSNFEATLAGKGLALLVEKYGILEKEYEEYLKCDPDGDSDSDSDSDE